MNFNLNKLFKSLPDDIQQTIKEKTNINNWGQESTPVNNTRFPIVLVLDESSSMQGHGKIDQINSGLQTLRQGLDLYSKGLELTDITHSGDGVNNPLKRVDISVITFGSNTKVIHPFSKIEQFNPPILHPNGLTPMGSAILESIRLVQDRTSQYKSMDVEYYRPWIFLITDGEPTDMKRGDDMWQKIKHSVNEAEKNGDFLFFTVGVDQADMNLLADLSVNNRPPIKLKEGYSSNMFSWINDSLLKITSSKPGEKVQLEDPTGPNGWGTFTI